MPCYGKDVEGNWYPEILTDEGKWAPSPKPADWEHLIGRYEQEALLYLRAVGAQFEFMYRLERSPEVARSVAEHWLQSPTPLGSHTMRTIARIAYTETGLSAVEIYLNELAASPTDLPPGSFEGVIRSEVSHYDRQFVESGGFIIDNDPNFDTSVDGNTAIRNRLAEVRERIVGDPQYVSTPIPRPGWENTF